jgi:ATP synthase protein I
LSKELYTEGDFVKRSTDNPWKMMGIAGVLGLEVVFMAVGGGWLGWMLDERWRTRPVLLITGMLLGFILGIASVVYTIKALLRE